MSLERPMKVRKLQIINQRSQSDLAIQSFKLRRQLRPPVSQPHVIKESACKSAGLVGASVPGDKAHSLREQLFNQ
jgi:hypothetical protein